MTVDFDNNNSAHEAASAGVTDIRELLWFKIASLASYSATLSQSRFNDELGMTLREWRTLGTIAYLQPATLMQLVDESLIDKGQTSRVVATLIERGWVERAPAASGITSNKGLALQLTAAGRKLHRRGLLFADNFTGETRKHFSDAENAQLIGLLDKLLATVRVRMEALHHEGRPPADQAALAVRPRGGARRAAKQ